MKLTIREIFTGFYSLLVGMRVTMGQFFKPAVTVHYPHKSLKMPERYRGHIELVRDEKNHPTCCVCTLCERVCPTDCIKLVGAKYDGAKKKTLTYYHLDFTLCSLCGLCVEACKTDDLTYSRNYNLASTRKEDYNDFLFKRDDYVEKEGE